MDLVVGHLGEGKEVGKILPVHVAGFFKSEAATMLKGKPRAKASILQIRRIVRGALVFWHEQGHLAAVPVPKEDRRFLPALSSSQSKRVEGDPRQPRKAKAEAKAEATEAKPEATADSKQEAQE